MSKVTIQVINNNKPTNVVKLSTQSVKAARITAQSGDQFQLIDGTTNFAPENVEVKHVGDDLGCF